MARSRTRRAPAAASMLPIVLAAWCSPLEAGQCTVPGSHTTVLSAVADATCTEVVLSPLTFAEGSISIGRDLTLRGGSSTNTTIQGRLRVHGATTQASVRNLTIDASAPGTVGCFPEALDVDGAELFPVDVVAINGSGVCAIGLVFADGFESGRLSAWSSAMP